MKLADKGTSHEEIAAKFKISEELAEQICRMYFTHPGVDVAWILQRIGYYIKAISKKRLLFILTLLSLCTPIRLIR